jgi:hypothetical protein
MSQLYAKYAVQSFSVYCNEAYRVYGMFCLVAKQHMHEGIQNRSRSDSETTCLRT